MATWSQSPQRAWLVVLIALLVAGVLGAYGSDIRINTSLRALLPDDAPSLRAIEAVREEQGATDRLTIAIASPDATANQNIGTELAKTLAAWPEAEAVYHERDLTPFRDHALYLMPFEDLQELTKNLRTQVQTEVAQLARPGLTNDAIPLDQVLVDDEEDWDLEYEIQDPAPVAPKAPDPTPSDEEAPDNTDADWKTELESQRLRWLNDPRLRPHEARAIWPEADENGVLPWPERVVVPLQNDNGTVQVLQARLSRAPTDVAFAQDISHRLDAWRSDAQKRGIMPNDMRIEIVGAYAISDEIDTIRVDLGRATTLSIILVCLVLIFGFRTWKALPVVVFPVAVSMALTLALAKVLFAELNVLTAFLFAVLFGMGVDFSVHLYAQRRSPEGMHGWPQLLRKHWRPLLSTMITTTGALWALCLGEFKAFREFGLISGIGVMTCLLCAAILVPALDTVLKSNPEKLPMHRRMPQFRNIGRIRYVLLAGCLGIAAIGAPQVSFENDTRKLRAKNRKSSKDRIRYGQALGKSNSSVPVVMLAQTPEGLRQSVQKLQRISEQDGSWVKSVMSVESVLPADQFRKRELVHELRELSEKADRGSTPARTSYVHALTQLAKAEPMAPSDLPTWVLEPFSTREGDALRIAHAHLEFRESDLLAVRRVVQDFRAIAAPLDVVGATSSFVFADLGELIEADTRVLPFVALAFIALCLVVDLRRIRPTLTCFFTLALGLAMSLGVLGLLDIKINFFNLAVMPAVVGLGIDASIHLWHARERGQLGATGRASIIAAATTLAAFAGLLAATNPGLRSMAELGLVAITCCVGSAFLILAPRPKRQ